MPRRAPSRVVRALAVAGLAALVVGASACNVGSSPAATVEGQDVSTDHVDAIIAAYVEGDPEQFGTLRGSGRDTYQMAAASSLLANLISQVLQSELAQQRDARPSQDERDEAETLVRESFVAGAATPSDGSEPDAEAQATSQAIFDALPAETQEWLIDLKADTLALSRVLAEDADLETEARAIYDADPSTFEQLCLRAIVVDSGDLEAVQARLDAGEDFGAVSGEVSIDENVKAANGELGACLSPQQLIAQGLAQDIVTLVAALETGEVSQPVDLGQGAVALFELQDRVQPAFEDVADQIAASLPDPGEAAVQALVAEERPGADITVDPRFGEWDGETGQIVPPPGATSVETVPADFGAGQPTAEG